MSIASDIRSYADTAVNQGKQVLGTAQASLGDVTGQAGDLVDRARGNAADLRTQAEKIVNLDAVSTAIEPYLAQVKQYSTAVSDRVEHAVEGVRGDKRVAKLIDSAESLANTVVDTLTERVVKPVQSLTGRSTTSTKSAKSAKSTRPASAKPRPSTSASTRPATKSTTRTRTATTKPARKTAAKSAARKSTANGSAKS